ncbi:hypothetical protein [Gelidibacter mesophilus]|uniref:hypothetical protein n=1 Tax=Gelidibacter mesophilus TaxID=169050 RepID=UPI0004140EE6|nr:hypothetical protein [Gelidibacter mesophilus]
MNKLAKFLAFAGLTGAVAYLTYGIKSRPASISNSHNPINPSKNNDVKASRSPNTENRKTTSNFQSSTPERKHYPDYSDSRTQKMYKDLGMTDEQKLRYERDYRTVMGTWEKNNPNYEENEQDKIDEHNSVLKAVLDEAQFSMYRDWFRNNPS